MKEKESLKNMTKQENRGNLKFSYININQSVNSALPTETIRRSDNLISWGDKNRFPDYIIDKITECPTLNTIVNCMSDYIMGDGLTINNTPNGLSYERINSENDDLEDVVSRCVYDLVAIGGFVLQIIRNGLGQIVEVLYVDIRYCRLSSDGKHVYFYKKWGSYSNTYDKYPVFDPNKTNEKTQFYFYTGKSKKTNYPVPFWYSAITAVETEIEIQKFHYNAIVNNLITNVIISINNGIPEPEEKKEIENGIRKKYSGTEGLPIMVVFNDNKEQAVSVERLSSDDFDKKYDALYKTTRQNIFASARMTPPLCGIMTETTGFSKQEFNEGFSLLNKTMVMPRQRIIQREFGYVLGVKDPFSFNPFNLDL